MKLLIAATLVALTFAMALGHGFLSRPILADDQLYFYMTERFASGVPPHVSQREVKTQLPTILGGTGVAIGRALGVSDVIAGRTACTTAAAISVILIWLLALELTGMPSAALVAAMGSFVLYGVYLEAAIGFQPKIYMMAFMLGAHFACARRRWFTSGFLAVCAFFCWQAAALVSVACGLASLADRRASWRSVARIVAGGLAAFVLYEAWFAWHGALDEQITQELLAFGSERKPIDWIGSLWFVLTESRGFEAAPHVLPTLFFVVGALAALWCLVRPGRALETIREKPGLLAFWIGSALATAFTFADHQAHPDMLLMQPYFPVAAALGAAPLFRAMERAGFGRVGIGVVLAAFAFYVQKQARSDVGHSYFSPMPSIAAQQEQADAIDMYFDHRGSVWVLGAVHLLALLHEDNWTSVGNFGRETADLDTKTWRPLKDGKMPEIIVCSRGLRPGFQSWFNPEYIDITPAVLARDRIRVYSRRTGAKSGFDRGTAPKAVPGPQKTPPRPAGAAAPGAKPTLVAPQGGAPQRPAQGTGAQSAAPQRPAQGTGAQRAEPQRAPAKPATGSAPASGRNAP